MKEKTARERIEKNKAKLIKLENTLKKHEDKLQKLYKQYEKDEELHKLIPLEVFSNFDTRTHYTMKDEDEFCNEINTISCFIHNKQLTKELKKAADTISLEDFKKIYYKSRDAEDIAESIDNKRVEIKEVKRIIEECEKALNEESKKNKKVDDLFKAIPQLKEFIVQCGEKEYAWLISYNENLRVAWEKYYKLDKELCDLWNNGNHEEYWAKVKDVRKLKPKCFPKTEEQLREEVEFWKRNESQLMAERIQTEFGEIISTDFTLGADGNVNGIIVGENKTARINTIFAGGYNIQCLHTRLLIHEK